MSQPSSKRRTPPTTNRRGNLLNNNDLMLADTSAITIAEHIGQVKRARPVGRALDVLHW